MNSSNKNRGLLRPTLLVTAFSIFGIIINFISQLVIAYYFGATTERDAYFVAITVPNYLSTIFVGSFGIIFLPKVVDYIKNHTRETLNDFLNSTFSVLGFVLIVIIILSSFFSFNIVRFVASGFSYDQSFFTSRLLMIIMPTLIFTVLGNLLGSLYQVQHRFLRPALAPIFTAIISLVFVVLLSEKVGIYGFAFGYLAGSVVAFIFLLPVLKEYDFKFTLNFRNKQFLHLLRIAFPLLLTGIIFRTTGMFERMIASGLPVGSISYLGYANQIMVILASVTSSGIAVSIYPLLSSMWAQDNKEQLFYYYQKGIRIILLITLPISVVFVFWGEIVVSILFERGAFDHQATLVVSYVFSIMVFAFIANSLGNVVTKIIYMSNKTIVASLLELAGLAFYLIPAFILSKRYGVVGIAMASSLSAVLSILQSFIFTFIILKKFPILQLFKDLIIMSFCILISAAVAYFCYNNFPIFKEVVLIRFFVSVFILISLYVFFLYLFKVDEIYHLKDWKRHFLKSTPGSLK